MLNTRSLNSIELNGNSDDVIIIASLVAPAHEAEASVLVENLITADLSNPMPEVQSGSGELGIVSGAVTTLPPVVDALVMVENLITASIDNIAHEVTAETSSIDLITADVEATLPEVEAVITLGNFADLTAPLATVTSAIVIGTSITANIEAPLHTVLSVIREGSHADLIGIEHEVTSSVVVGSMVSAELIAPLHEIDVYMGADASVTAQAHEVVATVSSGSVLSANIIAPEHEVLSTLNGENVVTASMTMPMATLNASIGVGSDISAEIIHLPPAVVASGTAGNVVSADLEAPSNVIDFTAYRNNVISAELEPVAPVVLGSISFNVINVFNAYAMCLDNAKVTEYTNFRAMAMAKVGGDYLSIEPDGVYVLEGETDNGEQIESQVIFGQDDFGTPQLKRVQYAYVGARGFVNMRMLIDGNNQTGLYDVTHDGDGIRNTRIKMGKGTKSRYWQLEMVGSQFEIESITIDPEVLSRKVA